MQIVLVEPRIPQNTGNIARLTAATRSRLHLIEPLGFEINDRQVKRAGLDYWPHVQLIQHPSWEHFLETHQGAEAKLWMFTTKAERSVFEAKFESGDFLIFGNETSGLSDDFHSRYAERRLRIPLDNPEVRSLNLANAVAIALYEAKRQVAQVRGQRFGSVPV